MGLIERPLALTLVAGFATGQWDVALPLGITLELLWLDVLAMGSIIPPFSGMAFLLLFPVCAAHGWTQPGMVLLPLILCMMAAHLGAFCELRYRISRNSLLELVPAGPGEEAETTPEQLCLYCLVGRVIWHCLLFMACYAAICAAVVLLLARGCYPHVETLSWPAVYAMASIGAVLSLRERRAYMLCGLCLAAVLALLFLSAALY